MEKIKVLEEIKTLGLIAVIRGENEDLTLRTVDALVNGGVTGIEITYSTPNAEDVVRILRKTYNERILLGMGTLTEPVQAENALRSGASFIVSPICTSELINAMVNTNLLVMAGALTPTEVFQAFRMGADVVKIFPGSLTGPTYLKALHGPFPNIPFMPTGGVNISNVGAWFEAGAIAIGVGSELCPASLAREGNFREISRRASEFVLAIQKSKR